LGAMPTLAVGMFPRENRCMATQGVCRFIRVAEFHYGG
jgi:hypothetical protein